LFSLAASFDVADLVSWVSVALFDTGASWEGVHAATPIHIAITAATIAASRFMTIVYNSGRWGLGAREKSHLEHAAKISDTAN
jgi:hypothetical protein